MRAALRDLRLLGEIVVAIVATWLVLGWPLDHAFGSNDRSAFGAPYSDGTVFGVPYLRSALAAGFDWTHHLYRFGVLGGSAMHDYAGTLPIVQPCALLGLSATATANVVAIALQTCFAFFAIRGAGALAAIRTGAPRELVLVERVAAIWLAGFAPLVGWRLAVGHDNLLWGILPFYAAVALAWMARAGQLSPVALALAALVAWHGVATTGQQMLVYGAVFGAPIVIGAIVGAPRGARWGRAQWLAAGALAAGVLIALPRVFGMLAYALGGDAPRPLDEDVTYSFGSAAWSDWLASIPWDAVDWKRDGFPHEHGFPIGPIAIVAIAGLTRRRERGLAIGLAASALVAMAFAMRVPGIADALAWIVPPLRAFRVPARAIMPLAVVVVPLALAAWWSRPPPPRRARLVAILAALVMVVVLRDRAAELREVVAWVACVAAVVLAARTSWLLPIVAALGVLAFHDRFGPPVDPIEDGPRALRAAVLDAAPELANPLARIAIDEAPPYGVATAFAAGLSSIDGDWNPPRRVYELVGALRGTPLPSTSVLFRLGASRPFPLLHQLYNVRYALGPRGLRALPATPGPAWFPRRIDVVPTAADVARGLAAGAIGERAWLLAGDRARAPAGACTLRATTVDALGQSATFAVDAPADCTLVVATNYVAALRARAGDRAAEVFPIDIALAAIEVPAGATTVTLEPVADVPWWSLAAALVGLALAIAMAWLAAVAERRL